ncbi:hypothetical protein RYX36_035474, partial [Vicia faba]
SCWIILFSWLLRNLSQLPLRMGLTDQKLHMMIWNEERCHVENLTRMLNIGLLQVVKPQI